VTINNRRDKIVSISHHMKSKEIKNIQGIQRTLILPLWGRAVFSNLYPEILDDQEAIRLINSLNFDFSEVEKAFGEYGGLCYIIRGRKIDDTIKHFISTHPNATIVNIGAGLDTTFSRVDNGKIHWYDLDVKEVIALRKSLIPQGPRNICIAKSVLDYSWFQDIIFKQKNGILFIAGGVFLYFQEDQIRDLFVTLSKNFPEGELYFDGQTKTALKISNQMVKKTGNQEAMMHFYINNPQIFTSWSPSLHLKSAKPYFKNIKRNRHWKISTKINMAFCDLFHMVSFFHLKFKKIITYRTY
jgi:O-methyltransferase involved in polyketide biosynthesis